MLLSQVGSLDPAQALDESDLCWALIDVSLLRRRGAPPSSRVSTLRLLAAGCVEERIVSDMLACTVNDRPVTRPRPAPEAACNVPRKPIYGKLAAPALSRSARRAFVGCWQRRGLHACSARRPVPGPSARCATTPLRGRRAGGWCEARRHMRRPVRR